MLLLGGAGSPALPCPVVVTVITCPDCGARLAGQNLTHERTCPLGLAIDERSAADRAWFAAHPFATEYRRALHWSERAELVLWGLFPDVDGETVGRVLVRQLAPGVRTRTYSDVVVLLGEVAR